MDESTWSTRNVAEYAYCPRLFYFMEVEGVFLPSDDTERGNAVHKRVDKPSAESKDDETPSDSEERPRVVRSLTLSSERLNLTAKLDLAEITGERAIPIEYRKGRPNHLARPGSDLGEDEEGDAHRSTQVEPWPTDRVQVGLQAILLEEAGYTVDEAVLYYAAEKRRVRVPVDDALRAEALATLDAARKCAEGPRPLPLVNDRRCVRCSLQPICLPDEVNFERARDPSDEHTPRKMWPPRDDGIHVVTQQQGVKVGVHGLSMRVTDRAGQLVKEVPLASVCSLSLVGSVQVSTQALQVFTEREIPVAFLTGAGRLVAFVDPLGPSSVAVRRAQSRRFDDPQVCLDLSRALVAAKIENQRTLLMRNHTGLAASVPLLLDAEREKALTADSLDSLRGHEGQAAAIYFGQFAGMFKGEEAREFESNGRKRRPPPDPINSCLSMAYSMLVHECTSALRVASLDPAFGAFHSPRQGRPALALDLMEPFRPLIADSVAVSAFNRGELGEGHFIRTAAGCMFTDSGRRAFFKALGRRMETEVSHPVFEYRLSYRRMLGLHARMVAAWLLGEIPRLSFLTTR